MTLERLQKFISACGFCSRRRAEELITAGRVRVNGTVADKLGAKIDPGKDVVTIGGETVKPPEQLTILFNKPAGVLTALSDARGRRTVMDLLPSEIVARGVRPAGRLDLDSEGLLILTNDGALLNTITHPRFGCEKEYRAELSRAPTHREYQRLRGGVLFEEEKKLTRPARLHGIERRPDGTATAMIVLREGMKRQVRRMFQSIGIEVTRLERVAIGGVQLGSLARGAWRELGAKERERLLGKKINAGGRGDGAPPSRGERRQKKNR